MASKNDPFAPETRAAIERLIAACDQAVEWLKEQDVQIREQGERIEFLEKKRSRRKDKSAYP